MTDPCDERYMGLIHLPTCGSICRTWILCVSFCFLVLVSVNGCGKLIMKRGVNSDGSNNEMLIVYIHVM